MSFSLSSLIPLLPEILLAAMACLVLVVDAFLSDERRAWSWFLSQASLVVALIVLWRVAGEGSLLAFDGQFVLDRLAGLLKAGVLVLALVAFSYSRPWLQERGVFRGEYFVLGLFAVLGMMILISAGSLLVLYLGLELMSLSLYAMVAFMRNDGRASEAAMKYFVLGAIASGMLLYGMSILYGVTGSLDLMEINRILLRAGQVDTAVLFAMAFIIAAIAFKLGAVPFHIWIPDVYQGSPTAVTLFIGSAPKLAAFAMVVRLLVEGLDTAQHQWRDMLMVLVVLSLLVGNLAAIAQTNIKRMLGYSTVSHIGFLLLGFVAGTGAGLAASLFYTLIYAIMALAAFGLVMVLSRKGFESEELADFRGLNDRSPWLAGLMLLVMFSMAGVPLTAGFYAKLVVIEAIVEVDLVWLAVFAVVMSVVGAFYYLRVVKLMYFDKPIDEPVPARPVDVEVLLGGNALLVLLLGLMPGLLMTLCRQAVL